MEMHNATTFTANEFSFSKGVIQNSLDRICGFIGWPMGHLYLPETNSPHILVPTTLWHLDCPEQFDEFVQVTQITHIERGEDLPGRVLASGKAVWISDIAKDTRFLRTRQAETGGIKAGCAFPILIGNEIVAVLEFFAQEVVEPDEKLLGILALVGTQIGQVIEHERSGKLRNLSLTDELTGLSNRRGFLTLSKQHLKLAQSHRTQADVLLVYADMDGLKQINDRFGHEQGSLAISKTAEIIRRSFRDSDIIARLGGDEFTVLVIETLAGTGPIVIARLQENLCAYNAQENHPYDISLSIGVTRIDPDSKVSLEEFLAQADHAMYEEKRRKKNALPGKTISAAWSLRSGPTQYPKKSVAGADRRIGKQFP